ncbi:MAG: hypothetical protein KDK96_10720 [Chlamydiia bacterium]|nr:hypothetical protein [Chlamydiia bacterium]MCB9093265.1 hypothetical protein [Halobacteriovoraceae bacterium]
MASLVQTHSKGNGYVSHYSNGTLSSQETDSQKNVSFQTKIQKIKEVLTEYNGIPEVLAQIQEIEKTEDLREKFFKIQGLLNAPLTSSPVGSTLLHIAAGTLYTKPGEKRPFRTEQMIQDVLDAGADIEVKTNFKGGEGTPLHSAVIARNLFAIRLLLSKGANDQARDRLGRTPLERAYKSLELYSSSKPCKSLSSYSEIIEFLENYQQKVSQ